MTTWRNLYECDPEISLRISNEGIIDDVRLLKVFIQPTTMKKGLKRDLSARVSRLRSSLPQPESFSTKKCLEGVRARSRGKDNPSPIHTSLKVSIRDP